MGKNLKVKMKDQIKFMDLPGDQQILVKILSKFGGPQKKVVIKDLETKDLQREVVKVQLHKGGIEMGYNGILFLLK